MRPWCTWFIWCARLFWCDQVFAPRHHAWFVRGSFSTDNETCYLRSS